MTYEKGEHTSGQDFRLGSERPPDFSRLSGPQIKNGIEDGSITDAGAVHVLARKQLDWQRQVYRGDYLKEIEGRYAPLLTGDPRAMAQYCQRQADEYMTFGYPVAPDYTNYPAAGHWYDMAARLAHQVAGTSTPDVRRPAEPGDQEAREQRVESGRQAPPVWPEHGVLGAPSERMLRAAEANAAASAILNGIEDGTITDPAAVQDLVAWQLETQRTTLRGDLRKQTEAAYVPLIYGKPKDLAQLCLDEAHARLGGGIPGSRHIDGKAAGRWYAMAARFAWQAEREGRAQGNVSGEGA